MEQPPIDNVDVDYFLDYLTTMTVFHVNELKDTQPHGRAELDCRFGLAVMDRMGLFQALVASKLDMSDALKLCDYIFTEFVATYLDERRKHDIPALSQSEIDAFQHFMAPSDMT